MTREFEGKTIIVTGGSRGIGRAVSLRFAAEGARVAINYVSREEDARKTLEEIEADVIRLAIGHYRGRMTEVARRLGIGRSTLYRKLSDLGIDNAA